MLKAVAIASNVPLNYFIPAMHMKHLKLGLTLKRKRGQEIQSKRLSCLFSFKNNKSRDFKWLHLVKNPSFNNAHCLLIQSYKNFETISLLLKIKFCKQSKLKYFKKTSEAFFILGQLLQRDEERTASFSNLHFHPTLWGKMSNFLLLGINKVNSPETATVLVLDFCYERQWWPFCW